MLGTVLGARCTAVNKIDTNSDPQGAYTLVAGDRHKYEVCQIIINSMKKNKARKGKSAKGEE